jgi:hypothetical protein
MPVRVDERRAAHLLEPVQLGVGELELGGREVVGELLVGARPDDQRHDAGAAQHPGERHLSGRHVVSFADLHQRVDDVVELLAVAHRRLVPVGQLA